MLSRLAHDHPSLVGAVRRAALGSALLVAVASPQLLGGAPPWALLTITALVLAAALFAASAAALSAASASVDRLALLAGAVLAFTGVQALPLPAGWVEAWAPESVAAARATAALLGDPTPAWVATTRDPGGTWAWILQGFAIVAAYLTGWLLASAGRRRAVLRSVAGSILAMALVGLLHFVAGAERVFGLYEPVYVAPRVLAPLLNGNHLAGFLAMGLPLLIGLGLEARDEDRGFGGLLAAVPVGVVGLMTLSRGGFLAIVGGAAAMILIANGRRNGTSRRRARRWARRWGAPAVLALVVVGGGYLAFDRLFERIAAGDYSKLRLASEALRLVAEHPLTGVGRGAFSAVFVAHASPEVRFTQPENVLVLWLVEWGILVTPVLLWGLLGAALAPLRASRSLGRLGGAVGLLAIGLQNLVDFSLEMPGVSVVAALLLGAVACPRERPPARPGRPTASGVGLGVAALGALALLLLGPRILRADPERAERALVASLEGSDAGALRDLLGDALRAHPSEPRLTLLAGYEAARRGDPAVLRWATRSMELAPSWPAPHDLAARWLLHLGRTDQALLEVREAEARRLGATGELICQILLRDRRPEAVGRAAPEGAGRADVLDRAARCPGLPPEVSAAIDAELLALEAPPIGAVARQVERELAAGDLERAQALLDGPLAREPGSAPLLSAQARILARRGRPEEAMRVLERGARLASDPRPLLTERARLSASLGDEEGMRRALLELRGRSAGRASQLAAVSALEGDLELTLSHPERALRAYEAAHRFEPTAPGYLRRVAATAEAQGLQSRAEAAQRRLCELDPTDTAACAAAARLRAKTLE